MHRNNNLLVGFHLTTGRPLFAFSPGGFRHNHNSGFPWPPRVIACRHLTVWRVVCGQEGGWQKPGEVFFYDYSTEEFKTITIQHPGLHYLHHDLAVNHKTRTMIISHRGVYGVNYENRTCQIVDLGFLAEVTFEGLASAPHAASGPSVGVWMSLLCYLVLNWLLYC